ncbi:septation regulator SpoVG [Heliobacillus mobilis]|uniref:Septation regulator SpoVG n=2 Tax=Heliobacterium TaxID=2697 RepID=A0A6I3SMU9_HELMO|nr:MULTISPECIES: septation regulator SpoVG [Heliobacterium]MBC9786534.1 septation regulator SpoVG [Heliobacterium chlorum]MTV49862.1 septation regulator SpoVG [Heliobacterium mobile]
MAITDVRIRKIFQTGAIKAIASVTIYDSFVIHDIKVVEGPNGIFVAMPSRKRPDGSFCDIAHPITQESRSLLLNAVLRAFEAA